MKTVQNLSGCQKFRMNLFSRTDSKRIKEAQKKLLAIYPFEVAEQNIFVVKTDKKSLFDVYISSLPFEKKVHLKELLASALILGVVSLFSIFALKTYSEKKALEKSEQKKILLEHKKQEELEKRQQQNLIMLEKEYKEVKKDSYEKIYPYLERIYFVVGEGATVENLLIEKEVFSVEVTTKDAVRILHNFEKSPYFSLVKMNRSTQKEKNETVNYSGKFLIEYEEPDENFSLEQKIQFYENKIGMITAQKEKQKQVLLSEYIKGIRGGLDKYGIKEQYIQIRENNGKADVEFFLLSSSKSILAFLSFLDEENLKRLSIRNSEEPERVQTTMCFDSGIEFSRDESSKETLEEKNVTALEMNKIFYKKAVSKKILEKSVIEKKSVENKKTVPFKKLQYIGLTRKEGKTLVMAKDIEMNSIYKLPLTESELPGDYCIQCDGVYKAKLNGEYYEVKK